MGRSLWSKVPHHLQTQLVHMGSHGLKVLIGGQRLNYSRRSFGVRGGLLWFHSQPLSLLLPLLNFPLLFSINLDVANLVPKISRGVGSVLVCVCVTAFPPGFPRGSGTESDDPVMTPASWPVSSVTGWVCFQRLYSLGWTWDATAEKTRAGSEEPITPI